MDMRLCVRLAFLAAAFSIVTVLPAAAADECKDRVTAEGKPAKMRDLGAYPNSLFAWRSAVKDKYGAEYNSWRYSKDAKVDCNEKHGEWICVRSAKPCKDLLSRVIGGVAKGVKKDCKSESLNSYGAKKSSRKEAIEEAKTGWEIDVRGKHGKDWAVWDNASDSDIDCQDVSGGVQCIADATPCKP